MPAHDWTLVNAGTFHAFHTAWMGEFQRVLNGGLLPSDYYALAEQVAGDYGPDVLTLRSPSPRPDVSPDSDDGPVTVLEAPPKVSVLQEANDATMYSHRRRVMSIRHATDDQIVAMIEIVSPGNKSSQSAVERFVNKANAVLDSGCHLLILDLFPPNRSNPDGLHAEIWRSYDDEPYCVTSEKPVIVAAYQAGRPRAFLEPLAIGSALPDMPLFLDDDGYVNVPLEATYSAAYASMPERWRCVIEGRQG